MKNDKEDPIEWQEKSAPSMSRLSETNELMITTFDKKASRKYISKLQIIIIVKIIWTGDNY
jgi:hypothetical protein